ncbi:MAG: O-antigen ligase family protein [Anaerolineales bacterium]
MRDIQLTNRGAVHSHHSRNQTSEYLEFPSGSVWRAKWLPAILMSVYFLSLFDFPLLQKLELRWYIVLGLAFLAYIIQGWPLNARATSIFWSVYGMSLLGAILSLLRTPSLTLSLWNTVGEGIAFITFLLFVPVIASCFTRRFIMIGFIGTMVYWSINIQHLLNEYGTLFYSTFGTTGSDKNNIGFGLALSSTALFYLAVFWQPKTELRKWQVFFLRLCMAAGGVFFLYSIMLIYARSSFLSALLGVCAIFSLVLIKKRGFSRLVHVIGFIVIIAFFIQFVVPNVLAESPYWNVIFDFTQQGINAYDLRIGLLEKGWFFVSENPIIGVGIGGSKTSIMLEGGIIPSYYIANSYLTEWAERGILGLWSLILFIIVYLKTLRRYFFDLIILDQIWLLWFLLLFFSMAFIDMKSITMMMLVVLTGIEYEQRYIKQTDAAFFRRGV